MDSFEFNKIAGGVLGSFLFILLINNVSDLVSGSHAHEAPKAYVIAVPEEAAAPAEGGAAAPTGPEPIGPLLASADVGAGEALFKRCVSCHEATKGGPNKVGPDLWGLIDRPVGKHEGFAYSAAMQAHGGNWTVDSLNHWLADPKAYIPGNKMAFAGLRKAEDRANLIAWLNQQSDSPLSVDALVADAAPAGAAPGAASGETAPAAPAEGEPSAVPPAGATDAPAPAAPPAQ
ncbi:c-type cytochrome [Zavarzinia sp. CC-PAN008]|uniref:c-type cytochrome n=1 Tax=Zavarzinia sp. CC-PAN008 TaxID=3243332 RepID=UPI003F7440D3